MTYNEALDYMMSQLPMFHRVGKAAYRADLGNALVLDEFFGHPHQKFASIHIAGTNGKGSTSHMLASVLQQAGYKVGLYTSPHLKDFRERIRINGEMISQVEVTRFVEEYRALFDRVKPSFFEMTVA
ncbi:MAG TPA: bifunctional folylpolyglutamate synthase/dihydrofolate synthase, partial [Tenuifilaceae bacterium]|nr:bifunctional folylpolyglutamate synthase/dihydrofolate synthase [Tenuifilaceae bacterium]